MNTKRLGHYLQSLVITAIVTGLMPMLLIGILLLILTTLQDLPPLAAVGAQGSQQLLQVLTIFGSGKAWQGVLAVGATSSLVGMLFDTYAFCSHQVLAQR